MFLFFLLSAYSFSCFVVLLSFIDYFSFSDGFSFDLTSLALLILLPSLLDNTSFLSLCLFCSLFVLTCVSSVNGGDDGFADFTSLTDFFTVANYEVADGDYDECTRDEDCDVENDEDDDCDEEVE